VIELTGRKQDVLALAFSPDGAQLAVGGTASHVQLWDLATRKARPVLGSCGPHRAVAFAGEHLLSCWARGVRVADRSSGRNVSRTTAQRPTYYVHAAATAADGDAVFLLGWAYPERRLECRDLPGLTERWHRRLENHYPSRLCLCPDGLILCHEATVTTLRDPRTGEVVRELTGLRNASSLAVSPDGRLMDIVAATQLEVLELATGRRHGLVRSQDRTHFTDVAFHPSGRVLAASCNDQTVRLYEVATLAQTAAFDWQIGPVRRLAFAPDGMRAAAAGEKRKVVVWDVDL